MLDICMLPQGKKKENYLLNNSVVVWYIHLVNIGLFRDVLESVCALGPL